MAAETPSMRFTLCSAQRILRCALHQLQHRQNGILLTPINTGL